MKYNKTIDQFISYCLEPHLEVEAHDDTILWYMGNEVIGQIEKSHDTKYFYLNRKMRNMISNMFSLDHLDTQLVIKVWLEKHYDLGGITLGYFHHM